MNKIRNITRQEKKFFLSMDERKTIFGEDIYKEIKKHIDYLIANGTEMSLTDNFQANVDIIYDAITNINQILKNNNFDIKYEIERELTESEKTFFNSLYENIDTLPANKSEKINKILEFIKQKSEIKDILNDGFRVNNIMLHEAIIDINTILNEQITVYSLEEIVKLSQSSLDGWCSDKKCEMIIDIIKKEKPSIGVEIGVFGGRSLIPAAATMKFNNKGIMYGIEAWSNKIATEYYTSSANDDWWNSIDMVSVKEKFFEFICKMKLLDTIKIIESDAALCSGIFSAIDYLHIDGAHSVFNAAEDVIMYCKKVRPGGIIVMDDVNWNSTEAAVKIIDSLSDRINYINDDNNITSCLFFKKR